MITPSIGRRVWYWPSYYDRNTMAINSDGQACDAGIAFVWHERMINITVADHSGVVHQRTSVRLVQEGEPKPDGGGFAEWMPYQNGQAKPATPTPQQPPVDNAHVAPGCELFTAV